MNLFQKIAKHFFGPPITEKMRRNGLKYARVRGGGWAAVCDYCGANCGQCGITGMVGNFTNGSEVAFGNIAKNYEASR